MRLNATHDTALRSWVPSTHAPHAGYTDFFASVLRARPLPHLRGGSPRGAALWNQTHDWSQREKVFGAKTGYVRSPSS